MALEVCWPLLSQNGLIGGFCLLIILFFHWQHQIPEYQDLINILLQVIDQWGSRHRTDVCHSAGRHRLVGRVGWHCWGLQRHAQIQPDSGVRRAAGVGSFAGYINGVGGTKFKVPAFVLTLGMMRFCAG